MIIYVTVLPRSSNISLQNKVALRINQGEDIYNIASKFRNEIAIENNIDPTSLRYEIFIKNAYGEFKRW